MKRRKVRNTAPEALELADEFFKQGSEFKAQEANDIIHVMQAAVESEVVSLSANLEKARKEAVSAKAELDALCAKAELAAEEHNVALAKVREERQGEVEALKAIASRNEETLAKVSEETSAEGKKLHPD